VVLLEPHPPAPLEARAPLESRVVALSRASERLLSAAGAWPRIEAARVCAYQRMRIWHESVAAVSAAVLVFDAADVGEPNLGYILENRLLQQALLQAFTAAGGQLIPAALESLAITGAGVRLRTASWGRTGRTRGCARPPASPPRAVRTSSWRSSPTSPPPSRTSSPPGSAS
jgi:2-octaprenylphenol hydroxylase